MKIEGENMGSRSYAGGSVLCCNLPEKSVVAPHKAQPPKLPETNGCLCRKSVFATTSGHREVFNKSPGILASLQMEVIMHQGYVQFSIGIS